MSLGNDFFFLFDTKSKATKAKNKQVVLHQMKKLLHSKKKKQKAINKIKRQSTVSANHVSDKELTCKMYKELNGLNSKRKTT